MVQNLLLFDSVGFLVVKGNKLNQTNFGTNTPKPKFICFQSETLSNIDPEFPRRIGILGHRKGVKGRYGIRGKTHAQ
jgi:hypothetical protein